MGKIYIGDSELLLGDNVSKLYLGDELVYGNTTPPQHDYSLDYFTTVAKSDGDITFTDANNAISYSFDGGETWEEDVISPTVTVQAGDKVLWKGVTTTSSNNGIGRFSSTAQFEVEGNAMTLVNGDESGDEWTTMQGWQFYGLFSGATGLTSAENLVLPARESTLRCYQQMFQGCTSLTTAPELPATTLATSCYRQMFHGCTSLTTAPQELPATTLASACYREMFYRCTSLTTAPSQLPATTLDGSCYYYMFQGCTSLTTAPQLPATSLGASCYRGMFSGCTSLTTAPSQLPATTLTQYCYRDMFRGCTSLTTAPELPATTLAIECYRDMFNGCTSLTTAPQLPATTLTVSCYEGMFQDCRSLNLITCLATDISASLCTANWVTGVAPTGTFTKAASMTSWTTNFDGIPNGWTVQDYTPQHDYSKDYFTTVAKSDGTISFSGSSATNLLSYSVNGGEWAQQTAQGEAVTVATGDEVRWKGTNLSIDGIYGIGHVNSTCQFDVEGNVMSLISGDSFDDTATLANNQFRDLFSMAINLVSAENLVLPAMTLASYCYGYMFFECTNLTIAPKLPATTLVYACYIQMFQGCTGLNSVTCLATDRSASYCTNGWFKGVASTGTFTKAASMTSWPSGANGIPNGWTVQDFQG